MATKKTERNCPRCGTKESRTPGGVARRAVEAAQSAKQQAQEQQREMAMRRAMQPMSPMMPMGRPPQGMMPRPSQGMMQGGQPQRPPMAPPAAAGMPVRPGAQGVVDPRAALLRAILAQAQRGQR